MKEVYGVRKKGTNLFFEKSEWATKWGPNPRLFTNKGHCKTCRVGREEGNEIVTFKLEEVGAEDLEPRVSKRDYR